MNAATTEPLSQMGRPISVGEPGGHPISDSSDKRSGSANPLVQSTLLGELLENAQIGVLAIDDERYVTAGFSKEAMR